MLYACVSASTNRIFLVVFRMLWNLLLFLFASCICSEEQKKDGRRLHIKTLISTIAINAVCDTIAQSCDYKYNDYSCKCKNYKKQIGWNVPPSPMQYRSLRHTKLKLKPHHPVDV